jgi:hypothetical protein
MYSAWICWLSKETIHGVIDSHINDTQNRFADTNISASKKKKSKNFWIFYTGLMRSSFIFKNVKIQLAAMPLNIIIKYVQTGIFAILFTSAVCKFLFKSALYI